MRNSTRKKIEAKADTGIGGIEVSVIVEYPATQDGAVEVAHHLQNVVEGVTADLSREANQ